MGLFMDDEEPHPPDPANAGLGLEKKQPITTGEFYVIKIPDQKALSIALFSRLCVGGLASCS